MKYKIAVNDQKFEVEINDIKEGIAQVNVNGQPFDVLIENYEDIAAGSPTLRPTPSVRDLVNFLVWMGEPAQAKRKQLGVFVLFVLGILIVLTYLLYKEYWKDVH